MTSVPGATGDHSGDPSADQSLPDTQPSDNTHSPAPENSAESGNEEGNIKQGVPEDKPTADRGRDRESKQEFDDFGLPIRTRTVRSPTESPDNDQQCSEVQEKPNTGSEHDDRPSKENTQIIARGEEAAQQTHSPNSTDRPESEENQATVTHVLCERNPSSQDVIKSSTDEKLSLSDLPINRENEPPPAYTEKLSEKDLNQATPPHTDKKRQSGFATSEWSHQRLNEPKQLEDKAEESDDGGWKSMPALGEFDFYDDYGRLIARGAKEDDDEAIYRGLGGAGKGYTRVQLDDDAHSVNSLEEDTSYLFKEAGDNSAGLEGEELRDTLSQLQATKDLLTESQRIAYVGVTRLTIYQMTQDLGKMAVSRSTRKVKQKAIDSMRGWGQAMMARLFTHMDINTAEQVMIEQLAEHGVQPADLVRPLMQNARVKNPLAEESADMPKKSTSSTTSQGWQDGNPTSSSTDLHRSSISTSPPPYDSHQGEEGVPEIQSPSQMPTSEKIDIDLRWTVLCDLFLVLISDSLYDSRSRTLLERVGAAMEVSWLQICRFEKRVIDALEMQEAAEKENWDESEHMEKRRKGALKRKYMVMGLATVGGGLVIGLSAGLLAPVIGAGLAAGFTTIGVTGTSAFLGGAGGTALIASGATLTGGSIGLKASHRRTGAVQTFEYRPLHNNKRCNLIVTVSGWMTGNVDDVRLPFSTVDPIMGDIYSVLWEPEMLKSMGATINILATEALTQGLQQVLGSTILVALMASLQLPIVLTKLSYLIDNPWNVSLARAGAAGLILADSLMDYNLGKRPITLIGYSLGSRVIFSCLKELAEKGAYGIVQNVYLFGSPVVANKDEYSKARGVVSGRFVNGYASNDWILGYLFRATGGGIMRVAGLAPVEDIPGLENIDVTKLVNGHMDYRAAMPRLLKEVGWEVLSEEFTEIEDPDPENHTERQRELIREIDQARRDAEAKPEKKRFGLFKRGKLAQKKAWESYDVDYNEPQSRDSNDSTPAGSVLFDIDAIRAELASEMIEVKQLESTLPPMKLDLNSSSTTASPITPSPSNDKGSKSNEPTPSPISPPAVSSGPTPSRDTYNRPSSKEEEAQMTFDTHYRDPPPRSQSSFEPATHANSDLYASRPPLRSSFTMSGTGIGLGAAGVGVGAAGATIALETNAWADGEEGEIQMSFE